MVFALRILWNYSPGLHMKNRLSSIIFSGLSPMILVTWGVAAPVPAGRPREIASFPAHRFDVKDLAFSADGKTLVSGGDDRRIKLWDVASIKTIADIRTPARLVCGVALSPDSKTVASCGDDRKVYLWDVATGRMVETLSEPPCTAPPLLFSPDGKTLVCGYKLWDLQTKNARDIVKNIRGARLAAAFDLKGKLLVATANDGPDPPCFWSWDVSTGKELVTYKGHTKYVGRVVFSRDGRTVVSTGWDHTVRLWDAMTGENTATINPPELPRDLALSPDGKVLAVSCSRRIDPISPGTIYLFELPSGKRLATLRGYARPTGHMKFSPDGRLLASESMSENKIDGVIKLWKLPARYAPEKEP